MTPAELKAARIRLGLNIKGMAERLATPYRTYQDWELGTSRIPGMMAVTLNLMEDKMTQVSFQTYEGSEQVEFFTGQCRQCGQHHRFAPEAYAESAFELPDDAFDCCD